MKYLVYHSDNRVDIFHPLINHKDRAECLFRAMGFTCQIVSAGTVKYTEDGLDPFIVVHGSHSLSIDRDKGRELLDAEIIKTALMFF